MPARRTTGRAREKEVMAFFKIIMIPKKKKEMALKKGRKKRKGIPMGTPFDVDAAGL